MNAEREETAAVEKGGFWSETKNFLKGCAQWCSKHDLIGYILLVIFAILVLFPLLWVLLSSFKKTSDIIAKPFAITSLSLVNYAKAWKLANFSSYLLNSILTTLLPIAILLFFCVPLSYVLARFQFKLQKPLTILFMAGLFMNVNYIVVPLHLLINRVFGYAATQSLIMVSVIKAITALSFSFYLLYGYLRTLPKGYEEAAKIDGCGYWGTLIRIVVPLSLPSILTVTLFSFMNFWNEYLVTQTFVAGAASKYTLQLGLKRLMEAKEISTDYGAMYAGLILVALPVLIAYAFIQKQLTTGISMGGLKG